MKKTLVVAVAAVTLVATAACTPIEGTVVDKDHNEGYYDQIEVQNCRNVTTGSGKNTRTRTVCTDTETEVWVPECWELDIDTTDGEVGVCVEESTWNKTEIGDHYKEPG